MRKYTSRKNTYHVLSDIYKCRGTQIIRVGTSLPAGTDLSTIQHLENEKVVFPINTKGEEVIWHLTQDSLMDAYSKGYVRLSGFNEKAM